LLNRYLAEELESFLGSLEGAWKSGNGEKFSAHFTRDAHFIVFDGTVLNGSDAIGRFHQQAFDKHLSGTLLKLHLDSHREINDDVLIVFTTGGIYRSDGGSVTLSGESLQTIVVKRKRALQIEAFQNTRKRPIVDEGTAEVWKEFDARWNRSSVLEAKINPDREL
jgi:uncharacterized protein (TIGR02246 family)